MQVPESPLAMMRLRSGHCSRVAPRVLIGEAASQRATGLPEGCVPVMKGRMAPRGDLRATQSPNWPHAIICSFIGGLVYYY